MLAAGDIIEFRHEGWIDNVGQPWNVVNHFKIDEAPTHETEYAALEQLAGMLHGSFIANWIPLMSNTANLAFTRAKRVYPAASVFALFAEAAVGGVSSPVDEPDDALVITKRTDRAGRRGQGRMYLPGIPDSTVNSGIVLNPNDYAEAAENYFPLFAASEGWSLVPVVFSRQSVVDGLPDAQVSTLVQRVEVDAVIRRQTRREVPSRIPIQYEEPE